MKNTKRLRIFSSMLLAFALAVFSQSAFAQWGQPSDQQTYPPQQYQQPHHTGQFPSHPPPQQPYPKPQAAPQAWPAQPGGSQSFSDALGRFRMTLPQGTIPMGATYNFSLPASMCQVSVMTVAQDQMFQMQQQSFPGMLKQMGASIDADQAMEVKGRSGRFIGATMRDQASGMSMHSMNVFIPSGNIWVQVMGPEQNAQQLNQVLQSVLSGLEF